MLVLWSIALALGLAAEAVLVLPDRIRWATWCTGMAGAIGTLTWLALRPMLRPSNRLALAALAERSTPGLAEEECLTAAVGLADDRHGSAPRGAPVLVTAVTRRAGLLAPTIVPRAVLPGRKAIRRLAAGLALLALVLVVGPASVPGPYPMALVRVLCPWLNLGRTGSFLVHIRPGNAPAVRGIPLMVTAEAVGIRPGLVPGSAWLEWLEDGRAHVGSAPRRMAMTGPASEPKREPSGTITGTSRTFQAELPSEGRARWYRVLIGGGAAMAAPGTWLPGLDRDTTVTRWHGITTEEPPAIVEITARVEPPAYTGRSTTQVPADRIEAIQDSRIVLNLRATAVLRGIDIDFRPDRRPDPDEAGPGPAREWSRSLAPAADGRSGHIELPSERSGSFTITLRDDRGIASLPQPFRRLVILPDSPPVLTVDDPGSDGNPDAGPGAAAETPLEARTDDLIRLPVRIRDDFGVGSAEVHLGVEHPEATDADPHHRPGKDGSGGETRRVVLKGGGSPLAEGEASIPLGPLGLAPGDRLTYRVRAADNRPAPRGPNLAWSPARTLVIARRIRPLEDRRRAARGAMFQARLDRLKEQSARLRQATEQLRYAADAAMPRQGRWEAERQAELASRGEDAQALADRLRRLGRDARQDAELRPLADPVEEIAEAQARPALDALEAARKTGEDPARADTDPNAKSVAAGRRLEALRQADSHLGAVAAGLEEVQGKLDRLARGKPGPDASARDETGGSKAEGPGSNPAVPGGLDAKGRQEGPGVGTSPSSSSRAGRSTTAGSVDDSSASPAGGLGSSWRQKAGRRWGELPGLLRSQILQTSPASFREEYARQIEQYYRILAEPPRDEPNSPP